MLHSTHMDGGAKRELPRTGTIEADHGAAYRCAMSSMDVAAFSTIVGPLYE